MPDLVLDRGRHQRILHQHFEVSQRPDDFDDVELGFETVLGLFVELLEFWLVRPEATWEQASEFVGQVESDFVRHLDLDGAVVGVLGSCTLDLASFITAVCFVVVVFDLDEQGSVRAIGEKKFLGRLQNEAVL